MSFPPLQEDPIDPIPEDPIASSDEDINLFVDGPSVLSPQPPVPASGPPPMEYPLDLDQEEAPTQARGTQEVRSLEEQTVSRVGVENNSDGNTLLW